MTEDQPLQPDRLLTRRQAVATSATTALGLWLAGCGDDGEGARSPAAGSTPAAPSNSSCVLTPEMTEGPYYIEDSMVRRDITEGKDGLPLELVLAVQTAGSCAAISDATVEVWHCDALGVYSGFTAQGAGDGGGPGAAPDGDGAAPPSRGGPPPGASPPPDGAGGPPDDGGGPPGGGGAGPTDAEKFLRGAQRSDRRGEVRFATVFPGWYAGRTPHIHVKVNVGGDEVHTGQLFFDDATTKAVYRRAPYSSHGEPTTTNASDGIYADGGRDSTLALSRQGEGYLGRLTLGVQA